MEAASAASAALIATLTGLSTLAMETQAKTEPLKAALKYSNQQFG